MRIFAGILAVAVIVTLMTRLNMTASENATSFLGAVWIDYRFFTIWTNTVIAAVCVGLAFGRTVPQWLSAGSALSIALVAGVYHALLAQGRNLVGLEWGVDVMVHTVIPAAFIGLWMFALAKDRLAWGNLLIWMAYPLIYSIYAIGRGAVDGIYPYFFLDIANLGSGGVAIWVAGLSAVFVMAGTLLMIGVRKTVSHA